MKIVGERRENDGKLGWKKVRVRAKFLNRRARVRA